MSSITPNDVDLGEWVYCKEHVGPHRSGWCTVGRDRKIGLKATTDREARDEVDAMGLHRYGYCDICKAWVANEPWLYKDRRTTCPHHDEEENAHA